MKCWQLNSSSGVILDCNVLCEVGNGQWWAEAAEEHSDSGSHPRAPDGQDRRHSYWPAAVWQMQEKELHIQPGTTVFFWKYKSVTVIEIFPG